MKKLVLGTTAILLFAGVTFAQEKNKKSESGSAATCCKKDQAKGGACCKQPSKTAALRTAAVKQAKPTQAPAPVAKPSGK